MACGEESFLNSLVKMFKLPALTLALGRAVGSPTPVVVPATRLAKEHPRQERGDLMAPQSREERHGVTPCPLPRSLPSDQMEKC